jgi:predicted extracellular nuclease
MVNTTLVRVAIFSFFVNVCLVSGAFAVSKEDGSVRVMSYNVENLFDTEHDEGKSDYEFLPKSNSLKAKGCKTVPSNFRRRCFETDWTPERLQLKLKQIHRSVLSLGALPDVLALSEVENRRVVEMLAKEMGYQGVVLEEGGDGRGIDVGLMYNEDKLVYLGHSARHPNDAVQGRPTRDILSVYFQLKADKNKNTLVVYVNHWPSQAAPATKRYAVAEQLKKFIEDDRQKYGEDLHVLATGDFNTIDQDWPHPHNGVLLSEEWDGHLVDALTLKSPGYNFPLGTYFYYVKSVWNYLDRIFLSQNLKDGKGMEAIKGTFNVGRSEFNSYTYVYDNPKYQQYGTRVTGVPMPYNHNTSVESGAGFSDHFPVYIDLTVQ